MFWFSSVQKTPLHTEVLIVEICEAHNSPKVKCHPGYNKVHIHALLYDAWSGGLTKYSAITFIIKVIQILIFSSI